MNKFLNPAPLGLNTILTLIRIIVGLSMIYHGWETFDAAKIKEYTTWDIFKTSSSPYFMVYLGKISELIAGILLLFGFLTRIGCVILLCTMLYIAFKVGNGKIWYEDQYPFLFALLGLVFFATGPGSFSIDNLLFKKKLTN